MARCNIRMGWITGVWFSLCLLGTAFAVFGIFYSASTSEHQIFYNTVALAISSNAQAMANRLITNLRESAKAMLLSDPQALQCNMPSTGYVPERMVRLFEALSTSGTRQLGSMGIIRFANNTQNGKWSWQLAADYGCPRYIYAFADPQIYPAFWGYCANISSNGSVLVDTTTLAYNGTDWGLKPIEKDLLLASPGRELFLPITPLLGYLTLTIERSYGCVNPTSVNATTYAAVFAEQKLSQLDDALQAMVTQTDGNKTGDIVFIVERITGNLVAASIDGQTQKPDPNNSWSALRVKASEAPDATIASIAKALGDTTTRADGRIETENWWILTSRFTQDSTINDGGIDWLVVTATPTKGFVDSLKKASVTSIVLSLVIIIAMLAVTLGCTYAFIILPLRRMSDYEEFKSNDQGDDERLIEFDEIGRVKDAFRTLDASKKTSHI